MVGIGPTELATMLVIWFGGLYSLPMLGVPHPIDEGLRSTAPPECLFYYSYQGIAAPRADSANEFEQLLSEPEIVAFVGEILRLADEGVKHIPTSNDKERLLAQHLPVIVKTLLARPSNLYITRVPQAGQQPDGAGGLVVHAGAEFAKLVAALEALEKLYLAQAPPDQRVTVTQSGGATLRKLPTPPGVPSVVWGTLEPYVFLTVGKNEELNVVERLTTKAGAPKWLVALEDELGIERLASLAYVNAPEVLKTTEGHLTSENAQLPPGEVQKWIGLLGVGHLRHLTFATGLSQDLVVSKTLAGHDGQPTGLLALGKPVALKLDDLKGIPAAADFAAVFRLDLAELFTSGMRLANQVSPEIGGQVNGVLGLLEQQLGFSIPNDLLPALGDSWSLYHASEDGGLLLTGLCGSVSIRDRAKFEALLAKVERKVGEQLGGGSPLVVRKSNLGGHDISYAIAAKLPSPVAPAWHWQGDRVTFALSPQMLRAHLSRPAKNETLAQVPAIAKLVGSGQVTSVGYTNMPFFVKLGYSYVQYLATAGAGLMEGATGVQADIAKFPSFAAINRHLRPAISVTRYTPNSLVYERHTSGFLADLQLTSWFSSTMLGMIVPAVQKARDSAREVSDLNNLRQIGLAILSYEAAQGKLPPRAISKNGKPLLSWRVAILPYLDQQALYDQFKLDEPWDSEHNSKFVLQMPAVFRSASEEGRLLGGETLFQIPGGKGTLFDTTKPLKLFDTVKFGGAALVVVSDNQHAISWTQPDELELDADDPTAALGRNGQGDVVLLLADGSVQRFDLGRLEELQKLLLPRAKK